MTIIFRKHSSAWLRAKHVYGYEVVPEAIADARKNAKLNGINNATFVQGDLNKINESFGKEFPKPDIIISGSYWSIQRCCSWALKFNYAICSEIKIWEEATVLFKFSFISILPSYLQVTTDFVWSLTSFTFHEMKHQTLGSYAGSVVILVCFVTQLSIINFTDPNRPGMHMKLIKWLLEVKAPRIVYVSCNPATCARDLDYLCHGVVCFVLLLVAIKYLLIF